MASSESSRIVALYRSWVARQRADMTAQDIRHLFEEWSYLTAEPGGVDFIEVAAGGVPAMWVVPKHCADDKVLLCAHGGGYVGGSMYVHRKLFAHIAKAAGCKALNVNYRLAPEFPHPASVNDMTDAYGWLLSEGYEPSAIALVGDSAGGALALTNIENIRARKMPVPAAAVAMSPWACKDTSGASYDYNRDNDVLTKREMSAGIAAMVLGQGDMYDPLINPLYIDYTGYPPIYIQVGGYESILDDSTRVADSAKRAGVAVRIDIFPEMQHCFELMAGVAPEAEDAIQRIAAFVRPILGIRD